MRKNFYSELDLRYPEYAIALEKILSGDKGKFYVPILLPTMTDSKIVTKEHPKESTNKVKNKCSLGLKVFKECNYIELKMPNYLGGVDKGDKVIISFIGGDLYTSNIHIIGKVG